MQPVRYNDMATVIEHRAGGMAEALALATDQDLDALERHCLGMVQAIRRIRGKPPLVTASQQRKVAHAVKDPSVGG